MTASIAALVEELKHAPPPASERPWYVGLLLGVAGWFAGIFLLIFVFLLFRPDSPGAALVAGVVLLAAAWGLFMVDRDAAFVSQLALALSVAGQFGVLFGVHEMFFKGSSGVAPVALTAVGLQLAVLVVMPNRLHRTMSTLFACIAWAIFVRYGLWDSHAWIRPGKVEAPSLGMAMLGWMIVWVPVGAALYGLIRTEPAWMAAGRQALLRPVSVGLIAGLAAATLISHPIDSVPWSAQHLQQNWLALWPLLSAIAALGALAAAFALGSRGLIAVCIVAALLHASHFYYAMGTTLLIKSVIMMVMGAALLGAARYLKGPAAP